MPDNCIQKYELVITTYTCFNGMRAILFLNTWYGDLKTSEMIDSYELQVGEIKTDSEIYNELTELFSKHGANQSNTTINFPPHAASLIEMFRYYGYDTTKFLRGKQ